MRQAIELVFDDESLSGEAAQLRSAASDFLNRCDEALEEAFEAALRRHDMSEREALELFGSYNYDNDVHRSTRAKRIGDVARAFLSKELSTF